MKMFDSLGTRSQKRALKKARKNSARKEKRILKKSPANRKKKKRTAAVTIAALILLLIAFYVVKDNHSVKVTKYSVPHADIPQEFDGFKILQISDLKGMSFGEAQERLIKKIKKLDYDMILLTGDYLKNSESDDYYIFTEIIEAVGKDVPVYYILGEGDCTQEDTIDPDNRCFTPSENNKIAQALEEVGAKPVYPIAKIEKDGAAIYLTGIKYYEKAFDSVNFDSDKCFSICVTHAPINYNISKRLSSVNSLSQKEVDMDMVISGHTLGGTVRLPFLGAVYTEEGGVFPEELYVKGKYSLSDGRISVISSGLGRNEGSWFRLCNTPEIVLIELKSQQGAQ